MADETYVFGSFQLIPAQRLLLNNGKSLRLGSRELSPNFGDGLKNQAAA